MSEMLNNNFLKVLQISDIYQFHFASQSNRNCSETVLNFILEQWVLTFNVPTIRRDVQ